MVALCRNGHLTGYRKCTMCGADRVPNLTQGSGTVLVKSHQRPRDENGRNALDELRRETRVLAGCHYIGRGAQ